MPDDDRFPRYLSPAWRKVLRYLEGHDPTERVTDAVTKALAGTIRTVHGVPSLSALAARMREAAMKGDSFLPGPPASRTHVPTRIAERAAVSMAVTMQSELALVSPAEATLLLARHVVRDFAYHFGFDRMVQELPQDSYGQGDLRAVMSAVLDGESIGRLAARFASRPTGEGLRAPSRSRPKRTLPDVVFADLDEL